MAPLLGDLITGWAPECMDCPQVGRGGVFRQIASNCFQTCISPIALCKSCINEAKKCFGTGFGSTRALNRWSVQERAHQFLPYNSSGIKVSGKRTVQTGTCLNFEQIGTLLYKCGGSGKGLGGGGSFWAGFPKFTRHLSGNF